MQLHRKLSALAGVLLSVALLLPQAPVLAQRVPVPVEEAGSHSAAPAGNSPQSQSPDNQNNDILVNMYLQLEALQNEVQNLRGLVEEQSYRIRRMETQQRDRYLDVDSRISELTTELEEVKKNASLALQQSSSPANVGQTTGLNNRPGAVSPTLVPPVVPADEPASSDTDAASGAQVAADSPQSEQDLYRRALNLLLEEEDFEQSITLFQRYIDDYPQGRYFTNSLYWQGAALVLVQRYNQAVEVLQRLINDFPQDPKAPTAMLRLGTAYKEMGNTALAVETWQKISELYPGSPTEIRFANEFLADTPD